MGRKQCRCPCSFTFFSFGDFALEYIPSFECPIKFVDDKIKAMTEDNQRSLTQELTNKLSASQKKVIKAI